MKTMAQIQWNIGREEGKEGWSALLGCHISGKSRLFFWFRTRVIPLYSVPLKWCNLSIHCHTATGQMAERI
jgi:hypothetical protein